MIFFKLSGKIGKFLFHFHELLVTLEVNTEHLRSFWSSYFGKQIDLFFMAFWVGALLLNRTVSAMRLCDFSTSFCNLIRLSFFNILSQLLECNVPLLFFLSGFPSSVGCNTGYYPLTLLIQSLPQGRVRSKGENEPIKYILTWNIVKPYDKLFLYWSCSLAIFHLPWGDKG